MSAEHLRSTEKPEFEVRVGHTYVWTECGRLVDSTLVDNEVASCTQCHHMADRAPTYAEEVTEGMT